MSTVERRLSGRFPNGLWPRYLAADTKRVRPLLRMPLLLASLLAIACAAATAPAGGATSTITVTLDVASASNIDVSACGTGAATSFGTVQPGTSAVTSSPCAVTFGSSNDTAMLQIRQTDTYGQAMFRPTLGGLDGTFNTTGYRITAPTTANDNSYNLVTQTDGKVVNVGWTNFGGGCDLLFGRYTTAGGLDGAFGASGIATVDLGDCDIGLDVIQEASGKLLFSGLMGNDFVVGRLTTTGGLDGSFGASGGYTRTSIDAGNDRANSIALQPDGKILVIGASRNDGTNDNLTVARYTAGGILDTTFGTGGFYTYDNGGWEYGYDLFVQPSGRIVLVGSRGSEALLIGLTSTGQLDTGFGTGGMVVAQPNGWWTSWRKLTQLRSGGFVVAGITNNGVDNDTVLARYDANGVLDTTFGSSGYLIRSQAGGDGPGGVVEEPDGRLTVLISLGTDILATRYSASGQLDTTFGSSGLSTIDTGGVDEMYSAGAGADGTIYITGRTGAAGNWNWEMIRLGALTVPDYGGGTTWASAGGMFGACLANVSGTGANATWGPAGVGNCTATDTGSYWHGVGTASDKVAASTTSGTTAVTANLHFGVRTATSQSPGIYVAPITLVVSAPNA